MCDDGNSFKGKKSWLMWLAQLCVVINHNACVRTSVWTACILLSKRSQWVQGCCKPPLHLSLPHISSLMSKTLTTCTSSTLQKPCSQETAASSTRPLFSYQNCTRFTLNIVNTPSTAHAQWIQHISVATAATTRDLWSRYLHNPHGSTLQLLNALPAVGSIYSTSDQVEISCFSDFNVYVNGIFIEGNESMAKKSKGTIFKGVMGNIVDCWVSFPGHLTPNAIGW